MYSVDNPINYINQERKKALARNGLTDKQPNDKQVYIGVKSLNYNLKDRPETKSVNVDTKPILKDTVYNIAKKTLQDRNITNATPQQLAALGYSQMLWESSLGTKGRAVKTNNPANIGNTETTSKFFENKEEGIKAYYDFLFENGYLSQDKDINALFESNIANRNGNHYVGKNNPEGYTKKVKQSYEEFLKVFENIEKRQTGGNLLDTNSQEYKDLYNSGKLVTYDKNTKTYDSVLTPITITTDKPEWKKAEETYISNNPKSEKIKAYLKHPFAKGLGQDMRHYPERIDKEYEKDKNAYIAQQIFKANPPKKGETRGQYLDRLYIKTGETGNKFEVEKLKTALHENINESDLTRENVWRNAKRALTSILKDEITEEEVKERLDRNNDRSTYEKQEYLKNYRNSPTMTTLTERIGILSPLDIPYNSTVGYLNNKVESKQKGEDTDYTPLKALQGVTPKYSDEVLSIIANPLDLSIGTKLFRQANNISKAKKVEFVDNIDYDEIIRNFRLNYPEELPRLPVTNLEGASNIISSSLTNSSPLISRNRLFIDSSPNLSSNMSSYNIPSTDWRDYISPLNRNTDLISNMSTSNNYLNDWRNYESLLNRYSHLIYNTQAQHSPTAFTQPVTRITSSVPYKTELEDNVNNLLQKGMGIKTQNKKFKVKISPSNNGYISVDTYIDGKKSGEILLREYADGYKKILDFPTKDLKTEPFKGAGGEFGKALSEGIKQLPEKEGKQQRLYSSTNHTNSGQERYLHGYLKGHYDVVDKEKDTRWIKVANKLKEDFPNMTKDEVKTYLENNYKDITPDGIRFIYKMLFPATVGTLYMSNEYKNK